MATKENVKGILSAAGLAPKFVKKVKGAILTNLLAILNELEITPESTLSETHAGLLLEAASKFPADAPKARTMILGLIMADELPSVQLAAAIKYFKKVKDGEYDKADFETSCGIGIVITEEDIAKAISEILEEKKTELGPDPLKKLGVFWQAMKLKLPFADASAVHVKLNDFLAREKVDHTREGGFTEPDGWGPADNTQKTPEILEKHLKETGGAVITRFPPEPNGYLHVGHSKAIQMDFGYAQKHGGSTILRFDDTNPETESDEYVQAIQDDVKWLGYKPVRIQYSSDYFDQLYEWAIELIKRGLAYVCHQTGKEIEESRRNHINSPFRDRTVEENLKLFDDMKNGKFEEGKATLRMKQDMQSGNSTMWDLIAYRIKFMAHHRTGDKWCIYPSYDFTHCLCDTIENVTHSLCTLEFADRREAYNWLVDSLDLYRSRVWEFARLNLTHTMLSKRKIIKLVNEGVVSGWDDPRLSTLKGYRRRGFSPAGILKFCTDIGVTRNNSLMEHEKLEEFIRQDLNKTSPRLFAVFDPIAFTVKGWEGTKEVVIDNVPGDAEAGTHTLLFSGKGFLESSDFRVDDDASYYGLALNTGDKEKWVKLKYLNICVRVIDVKRDDTGKVIELILESNEGQAHHAISWVAETVTAEVREYDYLFLSDEPGKLGDDWEKDLNPDSFKVRENVLVDVSALSLKVEDRVQFERIGYYVLDKDSDVANNKFVFNRTLTLKTKKWKKTNKTTKNKKK